MVNFGRPVFGPSGGRNTGKPLLTSVEQTASASCSVAMVALLYFLADRFSTADINNRDKIRSIGYFETKYCYFVLISASWVVFIYISVVEFLS